MEGIKGNHGCYTEVLIDGDFISSGGLVAAGVPACSFGWWLMAGADFF
jgi:hypothetical protein